MWIIAGVHDSTVYTFDELKQYLNIHAPGSVFENLAEEDAIDAYNVLYPPGTKHDSSLEAMVRRITRYADPHPRQV